MHYFEKNAQQLSGNPSLREKNVTETPRISLFVTKIQLFQGQLIKFIVIIELTLGEKMKRSKIITGGVSGLLILSVAIFFLCKKTETSSTQTTGITAIKIEQKPFGKTPEGQDVTLYTLMHSKGMKAEITNYGGIVVSLSVPDRNGKYDDIVLGYETLDGYIKYCLIKNKHPGGYHVRVHP